MSEHRCAVCEALLRPNKNGNYSATCGDPACFSELLSRQNVKGDGWPTITGEPKFSATAFANNVTSKPYGRLPLRPATEVRTSSPTALAAQEGPPG